MAREAEVSDRVTFIQGDLFEADISAATVVTLFLSPSVNAELEPKLKKELRPGTRIVSHQFPIGRWVPLKTVRAPEDRTDLFLWVIPPAYALRDSGGQAAYALRDSGGQAASALR